MTMNNYSTPYHTFQKIIKRYNKGKPLDQQLPLIPFHGLRHTAATLLVSSQLDLKSVSARLGHAQTSTTLNIYSHSLESNDRKAADAKESILQKHA